MYFQSESLGGSSPLCVQSQVSKYDIM